MSIYYTPAICKIIDRHIRNDITRYQKLSDKERDELILECMNALGNEASYCVAETELFVVMHHFCQYILTGEKECAHDMAETMRKNAHMYFADDLNELFDQRIDRLHAEDMWSMGRRPTMDRENGEIRWV